MSTPILASLWQKKLGDFTIVDYAFLLMRGFVVAGGIFWLAIHPYPGALRAALVVLFIFFIAYSFIIYTLIFIWPRKIEMLYMVCVGLDIVSTGLAIKLSGGFTSGLFILFYPMVALHSFYYGFYKGMVFSGIAAAVYFASIQGQMAAAHWTDFSLRVMIGFLVAGFVGFIAEKERYDRDELVKTGTTLKSLREELERLYAYLQDVKRQVERSEKLASIGRLSAELAHEINNPLDGIKNCLTIIKDDSESPQRKKLYMELVEEALYDIESAVRDLLDYAKMHEPRLEQVNVAEILRRTVIMAEYKISRAGIMVETRFDEGTPCVMADPHQLQEVFFNIIFNAIDAMPNGGKLSIEAKGAGESVEVKISDTGCGIPKEELENIFQPFYTTKPLGEGTGLGLPVSLEIVRRHNGSINVESVPGAGAAFTITLPTGKKGLCA